jgi:hypothetical protein
MRSRLRPRRCSAFSAGPHRFQPGVCWRRLQLAGGEWLRGCRPGRGHRSFAVCASGSLPWPEYVAGAHSWSQAVASRACADPGAVFPIPNFCTPPDLARIFPVPRPNTVALAERLEIGSGYLAGRSDLSEIFLARVREWVLGEAQAFQVDGYIRPRCPENWQS